ncbi:phage tail tape measure protein [Priestia megaterium]|uniref:phage tail tape measure protein n=1 Tax=Priestia megaterium TaxID=1404 RepID=UPI00366F98BF
MNDQELASMVVDIDLQGTGTFAQNIGKINRANRLYDSSIQAITAGTKNFEQSLDDMNKVSVLTEKKLQAQKAKAEELRRQYDQLSQQKGKDAKETAKLAKETENLLIRYNKSVAQVKRTEMALGALNSKIQEQSSEFKQVSKDADKALSSIQDDLKVLNSEYGKTAASMVKMGSESEHLYQQSQHLEKVLGLEKQAVEELRKKYEAAKREKGEDAKATKDSLVELNQAISRMNKTGNALNDLNHKIDDSKKTWTVFGRTVEVSSEKLDAAREQMESMRGAIKAGLVAGAAAGGSGMLKLPSDVDSTQTRLQRQLALTGAEAKKIKAITQSLWKERFGEDMAEVRQGLIQVRQNIKGLNSGDLKQVTKDSLTLAEVFDADVNEVTRAGSNVMKGFGTSSKEAFDLMAWGAQNGLNFSNEMFDNLSEYAPLYKKMGFSATEYFQLLKKGADSGVYNLDYINDAMKEFQIRVKDSSDTTNDAMSEMSEKTQQIWQNFLSGKATVKDVHNAVINDLKNMDDQVKANNLGVSLYGTKFEDLEADSMYALGNIDGAIKGVKGSMDKASEANENMARRAKALFRDFVSDLAPLGNSLLDVGERLLPKVEKGVDAVTGAFNRLSPSAQDATIAIGGVTAAGAGIVGLVGGVGTLSKGFALLTNPIGLTALAAGGLGVELGLIYNKWYDIKEVLKDHPLLAGAVKINPVTEAMAKYVGGAREMRDELAKTGLETVLTNDKISASTKNAISSYMELDNKAYQSMVNLSVNGGAVTQQFVDKQAALYDQMAIRIQASMDADHAKRLEKTKALFAANSGLTQEEEAKILANMDSNHAAERGKLEAYKNQIHQIEQKASNEKRQLTESEKITINGIRENMRAMAVQTLTKSEAEQKMILGRLKTEASNLSAQQAANVVKNSVTQRDKTIKNANEQYLKQKKQFEYMRDVTGQITAEQAKRAISNAKKQRDKTVDHAENMHQKVVKEAKSQARGHVDQIDWETGKVLDGWDKMMNGVGKALNWVKGIFGSDSKSTTKAKPSLVHKKGDNSGKHKNNGGGRAIGTPNGGIPNDQVALTGEEGPELHLDGKTGQLGILGVKGPEYAFLSKGSSVLPAHHTKNVLKKYGFSDGEMPAYKNGVGIGNFDDLMAGPEALWKKASSKFNISDNVFPKWFTNAAGSVTENIKKAAISKIQSLIDDWGFGGGGAPNIKGGATAWRGQILKAAAAMKESVTPAQVNGIIAQIQRESGGNQKIVQSSAVRDINTRNGNPARGLLQYIPQTFRAYAVKGHGNIYSGYDQLLAFFNNTSWRKNLPYGKRGWGPTGKRKYANGGKVDSHQFAELGENGYDEYVITTEPRYRNRSLALLQELMPKLGVYNPIPKVPASSSTSTTTNNNNNYSSSPNVTIDKIEINYSGDASKQDVIAMTQLLKQQLMTQIKQELIGEIASYNGRMGMKFES